MRRYALRDDQWNKIKDLLPGRSGYVGVTAKDNRLFGDYRVIHLRHRRWSKTLMWQKLFVEAVLYRYRAGIAWRDVPERFEALAQDADNEYAMIDSTIVKAHQHSAGAKKKILDVMKLSDAVKVD
jgi:transposase